MQNLCSREKHRDEAEADKQTILRHSLQSRAVSEVCDSPVLAKLVEALARKARRQAYLKPTALFDRTTWSTKTLLQMCEPHLRAAEMSPEPSR